MFPYTTEPQQHVCLVLQGLWRCLLMRTCSQMLLVRAPARWAAGIALTCLSRPGGP